MGDVALPLRVAVEEMVEEPGAARVGQELGAIADEPARRDAVLEAHPAGAVVHHLDHLRLARPELLGDSTDELLGDVHHQMLHGLERLAAVLLGDDLWLAHLELEALAPHHLDQDRELELAASGYAEGVRGIRLIDADAHVAATLLPEPLSKLRGCDELALAAGERRNAGIEQHGDRGLVD